MSDTGKTIALIKALAPAPEIDPEQVKQDVEDWLDDHPEATTTVQDGAITKAKLNASLQGTVDNVDALKSAITQIENGKSSEAVTSSPTLTTGSAINSTNGEVTSSLATTFACTDYIDITDAIEIANSYYGYSSYGFAFYKEDKTYISGTKNVFPITDIPSNAKYIRFTDYASNSDHTGKSITITKFYHVVNSIKRIAGAMGRKYAHFSFDDCVFWDDLTQNAETYNSIFDNSFLSDLKDLHDTYGAVFTLMCFIINGENSIADVTNKFASEFVANKSWLKFAFHGTDATTTFSLADPATVAGYYDTFVTAIYKMTEDYDCIDRVARLSSFGGSKGVCTALRDCGCGLRGFLCNDGSGGSYYMNGDTNAYINANCKWFDTETQLTMIHSLSRLESNASAMSVDVLKTLAYQNHLPIYEFFSHQDQFSASVKTKTAQIMSYLVANGFDFDFAQYVLKL